MTQKIKLLFIDDQKDFLDTMSFLSTKGYEVSTALSGQEGIQKVKEGGHDIVFVDFKMPTMDGVETIRKIREFNKTIPIVIVTAHADDVMVKKIKDLNVNGFFSKMGEFEELEQILEVVIRSIERSKGLKS